MVKAFSDYARPPRIRLEPVDLNRLVSEVLDLYHGNGKAPAVVLELDRTMPPIQADDARLRQVLHNLFKNALEAVGKGRAELRIRTRCDREGQCHFVELSVEDNGPGVPDELQGQLFEPYVSSKPRGTGLGLAIVKKIIEEHGGMIWARNTGHGAEFVLRLPVHKQG